MRWGSRFLAAILPVLLLPACSLPSREGPPAPVVQVTPRSSSSATTRPAESEPAPKPAEPPKPEKPRTQVYAYQDPAAPPEPEPVRPEQTAQSSEPPASEPPRTAAQAPAASADKPKTEAPAQASPPPRQTAAKTEPPKPKPKPEPPIMPPPSSEAPTPPTQVARAEPAPAPVPASNLAAPTLPPAAQALANQAEQQRQSGDYTGAAASLERSLRIAPREAYLWNRLARVRMEQGQTVQAGNLASRSNDLAGSNGDVKRDNWRMIAEAKRRAGDADGASDAERRANAQ
ncbi:hypothetical protein D779_1661 [Imhoffiella purpurea]|uniref:Uncharacterized protein n=1 Tax=Imhoffiella purpurea TaxID=1249627 RepID=W9VGE1_9GAMM|nr:hypothetical protein D779_1661 [Imhoffiella purpurea]